MSAGQARIPVPNPVLRFFPPDFHQFDSDLTLSLIVRSHYTALL